MTRSAVSDDMVPPFRWLFGPKGTESKLHGCVRRTHGSQPGRREGLPCTIPQCGPTSSVRRTTGGPASQSPLSVSEIYKAFRRRQSGKSCTSPPVATPCPRDELRQSDAQLLSEMAQSKVLHPCPTCETGRGANMDGAHSARDW